MKPAVVNDANLAASLKAIQEQLAEFAERITALESSVARPEPSQAAVQPHAPDAPAQPAGGALAEPEPLSEETMLIISAAIAAFIGKRPRIRQIRLVHSASWAQQGRVGIHTSHAFDVHSRSGATS